mmetsp:Transcript_5385/g.11842  ORF Transcript_5385/g.11842 Transcript_5385/m.11842 type:complete len:225 (+) Transcript_5385:175-849(+)
MSDLHGLGSPPERVHSTSEDLHHVTQLLSLNLNKLPPHTAKSSYKPPACVEWLVGTWKGKGKGHYPTIKDFEYTEELSFEWDPSNPRPLLTYNQQTWSTKGDPPKPMHAECGYVRVITSAGQTSQKIEFIVAAPNGISSIEEGTVEGNSIHLKSTSVNRSGTARPPYVVDFNRHFTVDPTSLPPTLRYTMDMSTTTHPTVVRHLEAVLTKWTDNDSSTDGEGHH